MKSAALTLASMLCVSTIAFAEETKPAEVVKDVQPEVMTQEAPKAISIFEKLDENKDGKVSPQEAQVSPALVKGFNKIDANKDGFLSPDEFSQLQVKATTSYVASKKLFV
ncbi:hypothetical protein ACMXYX_12465 [Neptuniibacter sp. QD72_48]|uniref:hypothetical protein n=1 Tax=unclassified Neptuniibacter TaxID=2630693 RepID=UPI0039F49826